MLSFSISVISRHGDLGAVEIRAKMICVADRLGVGGGAEKWRTFL